MVVDVVGSDVADEVEVDSDVVGTDASVDDHGDCVVSVVFVLDGSVGVVLFDSVVDVEIEVDVIGAAVDGAPLQSTRSS